MGEQKNRLLTYEGLQDYDKLIKEYVPVAPGEGKDSIVMGGKNNNGNTVTGDRSIALGKDNKVSVANGFVLGQGLELKGNPSEDDIKGFERCSLTTPDATSNDDFGEIALEEKYSEAIDNTLVNKTFKFFNQDTGEFSTQIYTIIDVNVDFDIYSYPVLTVAPKTIKEEDRDFVYAGSLVDIVILEDGDFGQDILLSVAKPQIVLGKYNSPRNDLLFSIGNGTEENDRRNILTIPQSNDKEFQIHRFSMRDNVSTTTSLKFYPGGIGIWDGKDGTAVSHLHIERNVDNWQSNNSYSFYVDSSEGSGWGSHTQALTLFPNKIQLGDIAIEQNIISSSSNYSSLKISDKSFLEGPIANGRSTRKTASQEDYKEITDYYNILLTEEFISRETGWIVILRNDGTYPRASVLYVPYFGYEWNIIRMAEAAEKIITLDSPNGWAEELYSQIIMRSDGYYLNVGSSGAGGLPPKIQNIIRLTFSGPGYNAG